MRPDAMVMGEMNNADARYAATLPNLVEAW